MSRLVSSSHRSRRSASSSSSRRSRPSTIEAALDDAPSTATRSRWELWLAAAAGVVFAAGVTMGGLTDPRRVLAFLDVRLIFEGAFPGAWDPTLGLVMLGALSVSLLAFWLTPTYARKPWFTPEFVLPRKMPVDGRLIVGAILFGLGWGTIGYAPGPVLASLFTGDFDVALFVLAMLPGMYLARKV